MQEAILSGLTAFVLAAKDYGTLDSMVNMYARVLLKGKGCKKGSR